MRFLTLFLFLFVVGCTTTNHNLMVVEQYRYSYIDSGFDPIVEMFKYEARSRGIAVDLTNLSMTFGNIRRNMTDRVVGYCFRDPLGGMVIKIHAPTWITFNVYQQEELVFHEIAHCLLGRDHCSAKDRDGKPISIMFPRVLSPSHYKENREDLIDELFNPSPECLRDHGDADEVDGPLCVP